MVDKVTEAAVVGGVDTHKDLHVAAVVDQNNKVLGTQYSPQHDKVTGRCWHG
jgi:pyrimidine deaminase RibD-like protein